VIALRVLHGGRVVREVLVPDPPITIGRGGGCDLVLTDESVSRAHARLERSDDGRLRLVDLDSRNGLRAAGRPVRELAVEGRVRCRVGLVEVEIEPVSDAPTREVSAREWRRFERRRRLQDPFRYLALGVAGILAGHVVDPSFWSPWKTTRWVDLLGGALLTLVLLSLAAGAVFVVLRAFGRQLQLADVLRAFAFLAWLAPVVTLLGLVTYYPLSPPAHSLLGELAFIAWAVVAVVVVAGLRRRPRSVRFSLAWAGVALLLAGAIGATSALHDRQVGEPGVDLHVQAPLAGHSGRAEDLDGYLARVRAASEEAAREAETVRLRREPD
jgi:hypothetical protein